MVPKKIQLWLLTNLLPAVFRLYSFDLSIPSDGLIDLILPTPPSQLVPIYMPSENAGFVSWVFILPSCPGFTGQHCLHIMTSWIQLLKRSFSFRSCYFLSRGPYPTEKWERFSSVLLHHLPSLLAFSALPSQFL